MKKESKVLFKAKYKLVHNGVLGIATTFTLHKRFFMIWLKVNSIKERNIVSDKFKELKESGKLTVKYNYHGIPSCNG